MSRLDRRPSLNPGDVLGGYQLLIPVGVGGMGQVWAAHRLGSPNPELIALKTVLDHHADNEDFERIFVDEARIASRIAHPNVCAVREFGTDRGFSYLAMQWVDGGTLHDILTASPTRRIDCHIAASIAASVCAGLHAAHELVDADGNPLHVVHRDVSPQNILIAIDGQVRIADFGIARAKGQSHTPTKTGELKGKLSYMAPEQLTTKDFDRKVDVFALGCVLYQATTGQHPFQGSDTLETMYRLLETDCPRPSTLVADYPMRLESIVLTALAKDSSRRYHTAAEFADDLVRFLAARGKLATRNEVAELVQSTLGEALRERGDRLAQARSRLVDGQHTRETGESGVWSNRAAWRWTALATVSLSLAATASIVAMHARQASRDQQPEARAADVAHGGGKVAIEVATDPPNGWLRLEDGSTVKSPWRVVTEPNMPSQVVVAGLEGYAEARQTVDFVRSTTIRIPLRPIATESKREIALAPVSRAGSSYLSPAASPSVGSRASESMPARVRKPRRPLDPENPY